MRYPKHVIDAALRQERERAAQDEAQQRHAAAPNATELEALAVLRLTDAGMRYEAESLPVLGGSHSYTPDWSSVSGDIRIEVKAEYIPSRDSRILFDAARVQYAGMWIWARKRTRGRKGRRWEIEVYTSKGQMEGDKR